MAMKFKECIKDALEGILLSEGQVIYCTDTQQTYLDIDGTSRVLVDDVIYVTSELDLENLSIKLTNKLYIVKDNVEHTAKFYRYDGAWFEISSVQSLLEVLYTDEEFVGTTVASQSGQSSAVATLASAVYTADNETLESILTSRITLLKTHTDYVQATKANQTTFRIPVPIENYDFENNYMHVFIRDTILSTEEYVVTDDNYLKLTTSTFADLKVGETVQFLFYYTVYLDLNEDSVINTNNYKDESITGEKIAPLTIDYKNVKMDGLKGYNIEDNSILGVKIADHTITDDKMEPGSLTGNSMKNSSIPAEKIQAYTVTQLQIKTDGITARCIAPKVITSAEIKNRTILSDNIALGGIDTSVIQDSAVTSAKLGPTSVITSKIDDAAVTEIKLATSVRQKLHNIQFVTAQPTGTAVEKTIALDVVNKHMYVRYNGKWVKMF